MKRFFLKKPEKLKRESTHYIIEVINNTDEIKDVDIFGSAEYIPKLNYEGYFDRDGVKVTNGNNSSYISLLSAVWKNKIEIQNCFITLIEGDEKQLYQLINCKYSHPNGHSTEITVSPFKDIYQSQNNISRFEDKLSIDFLTKLNFQLMPKTHVRFDFFCQ